MRVATWYPMAGSCIPKQGLQDVVISLGVFGLPKRPRMAGEGSMAGWAPSGQADQIHEARSAVLEIEGLLQQHNGPEVEDAHVFPETGRKGE